MSKVLIVSKTQMQNGVCVGGIDIKTLELIRLHDEKGANLSSNVPYQIGDIWDIEMKTAWNVRQPPHIEDKQTIPNEKLENIEIKGVIEFITNHDFGSRLIKGSLNDAFEGCLNLQGTKNFINRNNIHAFSTQFWISDEPLIHSINFSSHYYYYKLMRIKYVGFQVPIEVIPKGTIIRLSLANWWNGDGSGEERCYLQLSGWYL